jgi:hypothetical protein
MHVWRVDDWGRSGLAEAFSTVGEAISAANEDSRERDSSRVDADTYDCFSGDDTDYWKSRSTPASRAEKLQRRSDQHLRSPSVGKRGKCFDQSLNYVPAWKLRIIVDFLLARL